jgi:hypothetical protein
MDIIIYLFTCLLNNSKNNYKVNTNKKINHLYTNKKYKATCMVYAITNKLLQSHQPCRRENKYEYKL